MKAAVNQEMALVGAFYMIIQLREGSFEALAHTLHCSDKDDKSELPPTYCPQPRISRSHRAQWTWVIFILFDLQ